MSFVDSLLGIIGFGIGIPIGLFLGFLIFIHSEPRDVKIPLIRPLQELDSNSLLDVMHHLPLWVKNPNYERVDWLNTIIHDMWPYLDKSLNECLNFILRDTENLNFLNNLGICGIIRSMALPIFSEYIGLYQIRSIDFETFTLGTLCPTVHGIKVYQTNEKNLVLEPWVKWAGNPNITVVLKVLSLHVKIQLIDLQISAAPRIVLQPLVPTFPCFGNIVVSLMEKPEVDFGLKVMGGDLMAIPGLYQYVQETIRKQVAGMYVWPNTLEIPILDSSIGAAKKPVGILHVKVIRATNLLNKDIFGASDPYVTLSLSGERLPVKKTSVVMNNLNPVWNEDLKLTVKAPESQVLEIHVYDWEKVKMHEKLGMQVIPLKLLTAHEPKLFTLNLLKNLNPNDHHNKKPRGQIMLELTFVPFLEEIESFSEPLERQLRKDSIGNGPGIPSMNRGGLLLVTVVGAEDVEGKHHNNPYALVLFKGEQRKTKCLNKTRDPIWDEEFQFMLEKAPLEDKIRIEVMTKRTRLGFKLKESLGYVEINLIDVVYNGRINDKYNLINSKNGVIHIVIRWRMI